MKSWIFIDSLTSGGAQTQAARLHQFLLDQGWESLLVYYHPRTTLLEALSPEARRATLLIEKGGGLGGLTFLGSLRKALRENPPDTVVSFLRGPSIWMLLAKWTTAPVNRWLVTERSAKLGLDGLLRRFFYRRSLNSCDQVVGNSRSTLSEISAWGIAPEKLTYLANGWILDESEPPPKHGPAAGEPLEILMLGSLQPLKNPHRIARSLLQAGEIAPWRLHLVGRKQEEGLYRELQELAQQSGGRILLHGETTNPLSFLEMAHWLFLPSEYEGFPNVVLEAWAQKCPVLVSDRCDLPELVGHGETGFVSSLDGGSLEDCVQNILDLPYEQASAMGQRGYQVLHAKYSMETVGAQWAELMKGPP